MFSAPNTIDIDVGQFGKMKQMKLRSGSGVWADRTFDLISESGKVLLEAKNYLEVLYTLKRDNLCNPKIVENFETSNNFNIYGSDMERMNKTINKHRLNESLDDSFKSNRVIIINKAGKGLLEQLICEEDLFSIVYNALADKAEGIDNISPMSAVNPGNIISAAQSIPDVDVIEVDDVSSDGDLMGIFDAVTGIGQNTAIANANNEEEFTINNANNQPNPYENDGEDEMDIELLVASDETPVVTDNFSQDALTDDHIEDIGDMLGNDNMEYGSQPDSPQPSDNSEPEIPPQMSTSSDLQESIRQLNLLLK